ncbi:NACHT domain-containing protein [Aliarcobacter butzleri]|uniref:NACHT domain-containing protein n=1 Tax=Aliarcobacter butzleri TaxID=28197 RepID=UPI00344D5F34
MSNYIVQNMTKYLNLEHFFQISKNGYISYLDKKRIELGFEELYNYKYLMFVAEPGYGKTRLFKELVLRSNENNLKVFFIDAKQIKNSIIESIQKCKIIEENISEEKLQKKIYFCNQEDYTLDDKTIICLDALDELLFTNLYSFFEQVEEFIIDNPNVKVFLSCRTHHLKKIEYDFSNISFEFITLGEFYEKQVFDYLKNKGIDKEIIEKIKEKTKLGNLFDFLSIPRFLYYFSELIQNKNIEEVINLSRSEIFEDFIYRKIDKERDKKYPKSENHTIKRVLEELALVMKIFQVSQISRDDFFTIFKELNLGNIFTGKELIEKLSDKSLLKDNIDYLEFENQEFLDYLASKELSRFEKIEQVFFDIAVEPHLKEVYTPWFYVMPFVLEQNPNMINIILDFLEKNYNKTLREKYFEVITSINTKNLNQKIKSKIFNFVFNYHTEHKQMIRTKNLALYYIENEHYQKIIHLLEIDDISNEIINIINAINLLKEISKYNNLEIEKIDFIKSKFLYFLKLNRDTYEILHSCILSASSSIMKNDFEWVKNNIYFIFEEGIDTQYKFAKTCYKIAPNDKFSIDIYFKCDEFYQKNKRYDYITIDSTLEYIVNVDSVDGLKYVLELFINDIEKNLNVVFKSSYLPNFEKQIKIFLFNIGKELDVLLGLLKDLFFKYLSFKLYFDETKKNFFNSIFEMIAEKDEKYIFSILDEFCMSDINGVFYFDNLLINYLSDFFNIDNFEEINKKLIEICKDEETLKNTYKYICSKINLDDNLKEHIISKCNLQIPVLSTEKNEEKNININYICEKWKEQIMDYSNYPFSLFKYYRNNKKNLELCINFKENKEEMIKISKEIISFNPLKRCLVIKNDNNHFTFKNIIAMYSDAIDFLYKENIKFTKDEQNLIDNVFRYLPFNINSEYESTLKLAKNPSQKAKQDILDVYSGKREDDLRIYHPQNFIEFYKIFKIKEAEPILIQMLNDDKIDKYIRKLILNTLPKEVLSNDILNEYICKKGENDEFYELILMKLIYDFKDSDAFKKALTILVNRGMNTVLPDKQEYLMDTELNTNNEFIRNFVKLDYLVEYDKQFLKNAIKLRQQKKFLNASYFEKIVNMHLNILVNKKSFEPIIEIQKFLQENNSEKHLNHFEDEFKELKEIYLNSLSKPKHIMEAIKSYKKSKENEYITVNSSLHLLEIVKDSISNEIRNWIEVEGAYKHISELAKKTTNTNAEDFIQKTIKTQIELALVKKGLRNTDIKIKREEQTLDDKRADFTINYGFIGQVLLELKLSHNSESKSNQKASVEYKEKLIKYIDATNSDYGLFIIFNIKEDKVLFERQIGDLVKLYEDEENIFVLGINCLV